MSGNSDIIELGHTEPQTRIAIGNKEYVVSM